MKTSLRYTLRSAFVALAVLIAFAFGACTHETFDYNHPDVDVFVHQLKSGELAWPGDGQTQVFPKFTMKDIEALLSYADDLTEIPSFPLAPVSYSAGGKLRLGECILWTVESLRLGHNASMGCKMVHVDAEDYEGIYFLNDEEVLDAVQRYRNWWQMRQLPRTMWTIDPCYDEPLCGSGYMWW